MKTTVQNLQILEHSISKIIPHIKNNTFSNRCCRQPCLWISFYPHVLLLVILISNNEMYKIVLYFQLYPQYVPVHRTGNANGNMGKIWGGTPPMWSLLMSIPLWMGFTSLTLTNNFSWPVSFCSECWTRALLSHYRVELPALPQPDFWSLGTFHPGNDQKSARLSKHGTSWCCKDQLHPQGNPAACGPSGPGSSYAHLWPTTVSGAFRLHLIMSNFMFYFKKST